jgi:nucleoside-triphosphatase THEP1
VQACSLAHPAVIRCWQVVQSQAFRDAVGCLPGHDLKGAGEIRYLPHRDSPGFDSALAPATRPQRAPRARPRCAILCRGHGQDGSALLRRILRALQDRGVRVCGCLQVRRESQGKLVGYDLARIGRAGSLVLARRDLPARDGFSPFRFRDETFRAARAWLAEDGADARIAVIDSWGALEAKGQGHFEALAAALHPSAPGLVLGSARRDLVPAILHRLAVSDDAALRIDLPCAPRDERRFIDALARAVGAG